MRQRLAEPRRFIQIVTGARQVGKTTLVNQVAEQVGLPHRYGSADEPTLRGPGWIAQQWDIARPEADRAGAGGALLIGRGLTESLAGRFEIVHLPHWSYQEMRTAFGWSLEQHLFYGAYPGQRRWSASPHAGPATFATR